MVVACVTALLGVRGVLVVTLAVVVLAGVGLWSVVVVQEVAVDVATTAGPPHATRAVSRTRQA